MACGGGFDFKLVNGAAKDLTCVICMSLIKEATMFNCGHVFCNVCAVEFIQSSKQRNVTVWCPMRCKEEISFLVPVPAIDRMISSLLVYCENQNIGCEWKGEMSNVKDHLQKSCQVFCEKCCAVLFYKNFEKHRADCVTCPNKCGKGMCKDEVHTHLKICPAQLVSCPFHNVGCSVSMLRNSIQEHMKLSANDHLLLVVADSQKTKAESVQLQHDLQRKQMEEEQKMIGLLEDGEKLRKQEIHELRQEIGILKVKIEDQGLKITKLTKTDEEQQKEIKLLKKKEKNQETEIQEGQEAIEKKQDVLPPASEIEKQLQEISERKLDYIIELLSNENTSLSTFELLLTHNPHIIDMRSDCNSTIFHHAAFRNRPDVLEFLLSVYPSHIDDASNDNSTALMWAVWKEHIECVRVLLTNNADVNIKAPHGFTPLSWARKKNYVDIIRLLEEHRKQHRAAR